MINSVKVKNRTFTKIDSDDIKNVIFSDFEQLQEIKTKIRQENN